MPHPQNTQVIVIGDRAVGKTSLIFTYSTNSFPEQHSLKDLCNQSVNTIISKRSFGIDIWDTNKEILEAKDKEDYGRPRLQSSLVSPKQKKNQKGNDFSEPKSLWERAGVCLICFSLVNPPSLENVRTEWYPEIVQRAPNIPVLLIGTKLDLREDRDTIEKLREKGMSPIEYGQGIAMAKDIGAARYLECSALTQKALHTVFQEAVRSTWWEPPRSKRQKRPKACLIM